MKNKKTLYYLWYFKEEKDKDINLFIKEALDKYKKENKKILSVEVSKHDLQKTTTIEGLVVTPKKYIMKRCCLFEFEEPSYYDES